MNTSSYGNTEPPSATRNQVPSSGAELGTRIANIAAMLGSRKNASEIAKVAIATLQRHIAGDAAPSFDATARLCLATGVRLEWLATGVGPMLASDSETARNAGEPDPALLQGAVEVIEQALVLTHRSATPQAKAELILEAYRVLRHEENVAAALNSVLAAVRGSSGESEDGRGSSG